MARHLCSADEALNLTRCACRSSGGFGENEAGEEWPTISEVRHVWLTCRMRGENTGHARRCLARRGPHLPKLGGNVSLTAAHISRAPHSWIGVVHATGGEAKTFGSTRRWTPQFDDTYSTEVFPKSWELQATPAEANFTTKRKTTLSILIVTQNCKSSNHCMYP